MKTMLYLEGFQDWPDMNVNAYTLGKINSMVPLIENTTRPALFINDVSNESHLNAITSSYKLNNETYAGLLDYGRGLRLEFAIPAHSPESKKRFSIGLRIAADSWYEDSIVASVNLDGWGNKGFKTPIKTAAAQYWEFIFDMSTEKVWSVINGEWYQWMWMPDSYVAQIKNGTATFYVGDIYQKLSGSPVLYTDIHTKMESWEDTMPKWELLGSVVVESHTVATVDAPGFETNGGVSQVDSLKSPFDSSGNWLDHPLLATDGAEGKFTFTPVTQSTKIEGAMVSVVSTLGDSASADLGLTVNNGTVDIKSGSIRPPRVSAPRYPAWTYSLNEDMLTPDALSKLMLKLSVK